MVEHVWLLLLNRPGVHSELIAVFENQAAAEQAVYEIEETNWLDDEQATPVTAMMDVVPETADDWYLDEMEEATDA